LARDPRPWRRQRLKKSSTEDHDERKALTGRIKQLEADFEERCRQELEEFERSHGEEDGGTGFEDDVAARIRKKQRDRQRAADKFLEKRLAADGVSGGEVTPALAIGASEESESTRLQALTSGSLASASMASALSQLRSEAHQWDEFGTSARRKRGALHVFGDMVAAPGPHGVAAPVVSASAASREAGGEDGNDDYDDDDEDMGEVLHR